MADCEKTLLDLGLSRNEIKVYMSLLESGCATVVDISRKCKVHRTNVYDAIERLREKGMVCTVAENGKQLVEAADPDNLLNYLREKETKLMDIMPLLRLNQKLSKSKSEAAVYEGAAANRRLLEGFLKFDEPIYGYGYPKETAQKSGVWYLNNFHKKREKKKQWHYHIYNDNAEERIAYLNSLPFTEAKYLPKEFNSPVSVEICGDEVLITCWDGPLTSIFIKNAGVAETFRNYYNVVYSVAQN